VGASKEQRLQRSFSTFPDGLPGVGLLLLRAAAGAALLFQGAAYLADSNDLRLATLGVAFLTIASGALLLVGYLTPFAAIAAGLISVCGGFSWLPAANLDLFENRLTAGLATVIAVSLACLGPGAFSLDARLFGRHEIIIPNTSPSAKP
jgi:uncharacterized membrane protein YphA (DoxX/SURF4 family)